MSAAGIVSAGAPAGVGATSSARTTQRCVAPTRLSAVWSVSSMSAAGAAASTKPASASMVWRLLRASFGNSGSSVRNRPSARTVVTPFWRSVRSSFWKMPLRDSTIGVRSATRPSRNCVFSREAINPGVCVSTGIPQFGQYSVPSLT